MNEAPSIRVIAFSLAAGLVFLAAIILRQLLVLNVLIPFLIANYCVYLAFIAIGISRWREISVSSTEMFMVALLIISIATASYEDRQITDIAIDIYRPLAFIITVAVIRSIADPKQILGNRAIRFLIALYVPVTVASVALCRLTELFAPMYPAYSSIDSILGLGWLLASGSLWGQLAYFGVLLISGKRGVFLAAGFILLLFYRKSFSLRRTSLAIGTIGLAVALFLALGGSEPLLHSFKVASAPNGTSDHSLVSGLSAGRSDEIVDATNAVESPFRYIFGEGPGFAYKSALFEESPFGGPLQSKHRNLHFSPLSLLVYYGAGFLIVFLFYLFGGLRLAWRLFSTTRDPAFLAISTYFLAGLMFALTEFSIFSYANFAICLGLIQANERQRQPE